MHLARRSICVQQYALICSAALWAAGWAVWKIQCSTTCVAQPSGGQVIGQHDMRRSTTRGSGYRPARRSSVNTCSSRRADAELVYRFAVVGTSGGPESAIVLPKVWLKTFHQRSNWHLSPKAWMKTFHQRSDSDFSQVWNLIFHQRSDWNIHQRPDWNVSPKVWLKRFTKGLIETFHQRSDWNFSPKV